MFECIGVKGTLARYTDISFGKGQVVLILLTQRLSETMAGKESLLWLSGFDQNLFFVSFFFFIAAKEFLRGHILPAASTGGGQPLSHLHTLQRDGSGRQRHPGLWWTVSLHPASQPEGGPQPDGLLSPLCGHQVRETPMITGQSPNDLSQSLRLSLSKLFLCFYHQFWFPWDGGIALLLFK